MTTTTYSVTVSAPAAADSITGTGLTEQEARDWMGRAELYRLPAEVTPALPVLLFDTPAAHYELEAARDAELAARCAEWDAYLAGTGPRPEPRQSTLPPRTYRPDPAW